MHDRYAPALYTVIGKLSIGRFQAKCVDGALGYAQVRADIFNPANSSNRAQVGAEGDNVGVLTMTIPSSKYRN